MSLRPVRPADVTALRAFVQHLSLESRYLRFHASVTDFSDAQWESLVRVDGWNHVAIVAWVGPAIVGVARYIRLKDRPDHAEVAFAVADSYQRRGLGSVLRDELIAAAGQAGVRVFRAEVMAENRGMRRLLRTPLLHLVSDAGGVVEARLDHQEIRREALFA